MKPPADTRLDSMTSKQRMYHLQELGCICCWLNDNSPLVLRVFRSISPDLNLGVETHHLNFGGKHGGKRLGDKATIRLCWWHHKGSFNGLPAPSGQSGINWMECQADKFGPSWAQGTRRFRAEYGTDEYLLELTNQALLRDWPQYSLLEAE